MSTTTQTTAHATRHTAQETPGQLKQRWLALLEQNNHLRARNAATQLGVSEGELLAARLGEGVIRLRNDYKALLESLVRVGPVMTITRNDHAVNEKIGYYDNVQLKPHGGGTFDYNINLRIFFNNWAHMFAVVENGRHSIQIFDRDGTSTHKIYRTDDSDPSAWDALILQFQAGDQTPGMRVEPATQPYVPQPREQVDVGALCQQWRGIDDLHQFWFMLRDHKLTRLDALKLAEPDLARQVPLNAWKDVLHHAADTGMPIMAFTRSPGVSQIHTGPIHKLLEKDGWFNVLDPTFNLHLRMEAVSEVWVVYRPTNTGGQTSLELYHKNGELISHFFGAVNLQAPEPRRWRELLASLPGVQDIAA